VINPLHSLGTDLFRSLNRDKQEKVLNAAVEEFALNGYRNASMNSVVKAAGISKGSLFQYFTNKHGLFDGVVELAEARVKRYLKRVREQTTGMGFSERLERLLRAGFAFIDEHPLLARIYFHLLQSGESPYGSDRVTKLRKRGEAFLAGLTGEAVARGELRESIDVERVAFLINALFETLLRAYYTDFIGTDLGLYRGNRDELDLWVETTLEMILSGIGTEEETTGSNPG
jgi:AcrR family transcriptional regulator